MQRGSEITLEDSLLFPQSMGITALDVLQFNEEVRSKRAVLKQELKFCVNALMVQNGWTAKALAYDFGMKRRGVPYDYGCVRGALNGDENRESLRRQLINHMIANPALDEMELPPEHRVKKRGRKAESK